MGKIKNLSRSILNFHLNSPGMVLMISLILTIIFFRFMFDLKVDNSLNNWYSKSDTSFIKYQDFKALFGSDENIIIIYRNQDLFSQQQLELNKLISEDLGKIEGIESVVSLSTLKVPRMSGFRMYSVPIIPTQTSSYQKLKERIISKPIFVHNVISTDGTATGILVFLKDTAERPVNEILDDIKTTINSEKYTSNKFYLVGNIPLLEENNRVSGTESARFILICILLIFVILLIHFRHILLAIVPIVVASINVIWILGIYAVSGEPLNTLAAIIPLIILVVSIALSVHIITRYQKYLAATNQKNTALADALRSVVKPCFYTTITTFAAFIAFIMSDIGPVISFGFYSAIGILLSFILGFTLLPSILITIKISEKNKGLAVISRWEIISTSLANFSYKYRRSIIICSILIGIFSVAGMLKLTFESDQIKYFKASNEIRKGFETAQSWFEGIYPVEIVFEMPEDIYKQPEKYFDLFNELEEQISNYEEIEAVHSPVIFFKSLFPEVTTKQKGAINTILSGRFSNEIKKDRFMRNYLSPDGKNYRLAIKTKWMNSEQTIQIIQKLEAGINEKLKDTEIKYYVTGLSSMYINLNDRLMRNKINSFIISFTLIFLILLILFRNFFLAVIGMIPNIAPILTTLGLMGWLKIPLDIATILIAAISLGIAVDDTIHFLTSFRQLNSEKLSMKERIRLSYMAIARAVTLTSILLICGFSVMVFSSYLPFIYFGVFLSMNILFALLYDLLLLPAILYLTSKQKFL